MVSDMILAGILYFYRRDVEKRKFDKSMLLKGDYMVQVLFLFSRIIYILQEIKKKTFSTDVS